MFEEQEEEQREEPAHVSSEEKDPSGAVAPASAEQADASPEGCPVWMWEGKRCNRAIHPAPSHDKTPVCLMHSRDPNKSDELFQKEFEAILEAAGDGSANLVGFVFPGANYADREFKAKCLFDDAVFTQDANFRGTTFKQGASFRGTTFTQDAYFLDATFTQDVNFYSATFTRANFYSAMFTQGAYFFDAAFTQDANFRLATFMHHADFRLATFVHNADFYSATFTHNANFYRATFAQDADFSKAAFTQDANFYSAMFAHVANFSGATFTQDAYFSHATFKKLQFIRAKFEGAVEFRKTEFREHDEDGEQRNQDLLPGPVFSLAEFTQPEKVLFYKTYLGQALFHNCDVSKMNFSSVEWRQRNGSGKRMMFEEVVDLEHAKDLAPREDNPDERDYGLVAELYQQLKKNYDARQDYWTAGDFHYGELEMKRLACKRKNKALRWLVQHFRLVALYKYASHYGESYVRPALWFGATLLVFALLFPRFGLRYDAAKNRASVVVSSGVAGSTSASTAASSSASASPSADVFVLTYANPLFPGQPESYRHKAQLRLFGNSLLTALEIAAFQKEPAYQPVYPWGRFLTLVEMLLTSTFAGLFFLAVRRQFRR